MGWFDKKGKDGEMPAPEDRASLANLAAPEAAAPAEGTPAPPADPHAQTRPQAAPAEQASIFGESADVEGSVEGHGDLVLRGTVRGSIHVTGALVIEPSGRVQADVAAREVVNAGTVDGNITAAERVRIAATGTVDGDIDAPSIVIDDGGAVEGFVQMEPPGGEDFDDEDDRFVPPPPVKGLRSKLPPKPETAPAAIEKTEPHRPVVSEPEALSPLREAAPPEPALPLGGESSGEAGDGDGKPAPDAEATLLSAPAPPPPAPPRADAGGSPPFGGPLGGEDSKPSPGL